MTSEVILIVRVLLKLSVSNDGVRSKEIELPYPGRGNAISVRPLGEPTRTNRQQ